MHEMTATVADLEAKRRLEDKSIAENEARIAWEQKSIQDGELLLKSQIKAAAEAKVAAEAKAAAEGDLEVTSKDLKEDITALATLHNDCMRGAEDFESETKSRGEELKALATAKKIIIEATSGAQKVSYGLDQVSFVQLRTSVRMSTHEDLVSFEVVRVVTSHMLKPMSERVPAPE